MIAACGPSAPGAVALTVRDATGALVGVTHARLSVACAAVLPCFELFRRIGDTLVAIGLEQGGSSLAASDHATIILVDSNDCSGPALIGFQSDPVPLVSQTFSADLFNETLAYYVNLGAGPTVHTVHSCMYTGGECSGPIDGLPSLYYSAVPIDLAALGFVPPFHIE